MKRFLFLFFASLLSLTTWAYDFENDDTGTLFYYNILSNSTVEVTGLTTDEYIPVSNSYTDAYIDIPETVTNGGTTYTIVGIGDYAFYNCRNIMRLIMSDMVTYIGARAFFADAGLEEITLSTALTTIKMQAFTQNTGLTSITLPENVTTIESSAFMMCTSLKEVTSLNPEPPTCDDTAFSNVTLSGVTLYVPNASIEKYSTANVWQDFGEIVANGTEKEKTPLETGEEFTADNIRYCVVSGEDQTVEVTHYTTTSTTATLYAGDMVIPATVEYDDFIYTIVGIGANAFNSCTELTSLELPEGITYIGNSAFSYCSLPILSLPNSLTTIGDYAFRYSSLTEITVPENVTFIGEESFYMSTYLTEATINAKVNTLLPNAFAYCTAMISVTLPNTLYLLKSQAFNNCSRLRSITSHNPEAPICDVNVFLSVSVSNCILYVPKGAKEAYVSADTWENFYIVELDEEGETPPTNENRFVEDGIYYEITDAEALTCEVTFATTSMNSYSSDVVIPETVSHDGNTYRVTGIGYSAFRASKDLTKVTIPESVTNIGTYAFFKCASLKEIAIPSSIAEINEYSFYDCSSLMELTIPKNISFVGNNAFYGCTSLKTITLEDSDSPLEFENNYAFYNAPLTTLYLGRNIICDNSTFYSPFYSFSTLKNITFSEKVTSLVDYQFRSNTGLEELTLPSWITDIGKYVFYGCTSLKKVIITEGEGRTALGDYIFANCTALKEVSLPEGLIYPCTGAFYQCTALEEIVLPTTLVPTTSGSLEGFRMFYGCTSLKKVVMDGLPTIASYMFYNCTSLAEIDVPSSVTSISSYAFQGCTNLERVSFVENNQTTTISSWAFHGCAKLTSVLFPQSQRVLNSDSFEDCSSLKKVVFPNQTQDNGVNVFKSCTSLEEVILPSPVSVAAGQFDNCTNLSKMYVLSTTPPTVADGSTYYADPFNNVPTETCVIYVPEGAKKDYVSDSKWSVFANIEELTNPLAVTYCVGEITTSSVQINGFVAVGWLETTEVGFEYWADGDEEATIVVVRDGNVTTGNINYNLYDLAYGMRYTYRAYAKTATETFYGDEVSFTPKVDEAKVFTMDVTDVTDSSAVLNGRLALPYTESIVEIGFNYWTGEEQPITVIVEGDEFVYTLNNLSPETNYVYYAFAVLASGSTIYGEEMTFTTAVPEGISNINVDSEGVEGIYSVGGQKLNSTVKGVNIIRYEDGTVKKIYVK